jgi:hypothetical protein
MNLDNYRKQRKLYDNHRPNEDQLIISEKWVVALQKFPEDRKFFLKEFYSQGYYEAYDIVMTYAERTHTTVLWFNEKRSVGYPECNVNFPKLEFVCTYCNREFADPDPIPCTNEICLSYFCSKCCLEQHQLLRRAHH